MLSAPMVKTTETDAVPFLVARATRAAQHMVNLEIAACGAPGGRAAPAIALEDRIAREVARAIPMAARKRSARGVRGFRGS